ncbi:MAG: hypothetical protein E6G96_02580 [Alphaproteobacteria bacterium]|jgi:hypothetical protein|nr:MAG: hypothetical protein E6G96_02580 [Alphaproteobacteria bacterium]
MAGLRSFILLLALVLGAHSAKTAEVVYPPGSRLGLIPPSGMATSNNFFGFEDADNHAAIILAALPIEAYAELDRTAGPEALKQQGITLEKREPMTLSTGKAFLVIGRQEIDKAKVRKWILIGESPHLTALVTVQIPDTAKDVYSDSAIRAALATLAIRDSIPVDEQLSLLPFKVAELAGFRVGGVMPGRALMLGDPAADAASQPAPHMFVSVAPGGPSQTSEREAFARDVFGSVPNIRDVRIITSEPLRIAGQAGHQIMAQARDPSGTAPLTVVQWLRFGGGGYLQLVGIARAEAWHDAYPRFRAVRDGIEPR